MVGVQLLVRVLVRKRLCAKRRLLAMGKGKSVRIRRGCWVKWNGGFETGEVSLCLAPTEERTFLKCGCGMGQRDLGREGESPCESCCGGESGGESCCVRAEL